LNNYLHFTKIYTNNKIAVRFTQSKQNAKEMETTYSSNGHDLLK